MEGKRSYEKILICIAAILCAAVIGYNAFFVPEISLPTVIYVENPSSQAAPEKKDALSVAVSQNSVSGDAIEESSESTPAEDAPATGPDEVDSAATTQQSETSAQTAPQSGRININTSSVEELCTLPGVGEATAAKIIEYREQNGGFVSIEELMEVSGIGEKKFEAVKDSICV